MNEKRRLSQKIDDFESNGKTLVLWLMPNDTFLIEVLNSVTGHLIKYFNTRKDQLEDDEIALKFEQLKAEISNNRKTSDKIQQEFLQCELFIDRGGDRS